MQQLEYKFERLQKPVALKDLLDLKDIKDQRYLKDLKDLLDLKDIKDQRYL